MYMLKKIILRYEGEIDMTYFLIFLSGIFIGSIGGLLLSAILTVCKNDDNLREAYENGYKDGLANGNDDAAFEI